MTLSVSSWYADIRPRRGRGLRRFLGFGLVLAAASGGLAGLAPAASAATTVTCGDTISSAGSYALEDSCTGAGITITANNVTLKLNGHKMTGAGGAQIGVNVDNAATRTISGVTIEGPGKITGYTLIGVEFAGARGSRISGLTVAGDGRVGIFVSFGSFVGPFGGDNTISGNTVMHNVNGIVLERESGDMVSGNTVNHNVVGSQGGDGIGVEVQSNRNTLSDNTVNHNVVGIAVTPFSMGNTMSGNTAQLNSVDDVIDFNGELSGVNACVVDTWTATSYKTTLPTSACIQ